MPKTKQEHGYESGGIAFVGFILIGIAFGFLYNNIVVGTLLGIGTGFIAMAILRAVLGKK